MIGKNRGNIMKSIKILMVSMLSLFLFACSSDEVGSVSSDSDSNESDKEDVELDVSSEDVLSDISYQEDINDNVLKLLDHVDDLSELHSDLRNNNDLIHDDDWILLIKVILDNMNLTSNAIRDIEPPSSYKTSHNIIMKALDEYEYVVNNYLSSAESLDVDKINSCITSLEKGTDYLYDNWID